MVKGLTSAFPRAWARKSPSYSPTLVRAGDAKPIEKNLTPTEKRRHLRQIKDDTAYFKRSYAKADLRVDIDGLDVEGAALKVAEVLEPCRPSGLCRRGKRRRRQLRVVWERRDLCEGVVRHRTEETSAWSERAAALLRLPQAIRPRCRRRGVEDRRGTCAA